VSQGYAPFPLVDFDFNNVDLTTNFIDNPNPLYTGQGWGTFHLITNSKDGTPALQFNNVDTFISVANTVSWDFSSTGFTLQADVNRYTNTDEDSMITKWYGADYFLLKFEGNSIIFSVRVVGDVRYSAQYNFPDNSYLHQWHTIKATYKPTSATSSVITIYWDGNNVASYNVPSATLMPSWNDVKVGNANNAWSVFNGGIDNVKIWNAVV